MLTHANIQLHSNLRYRRVHGRASHGLRAGSGRHRESGETVFVRLVSIAETLMKDDELVEYIAKGVIAQACKLTSDDVASDLEDWKKAADVVISSLGFGTDISDVQQQRVFHYYVPVFMWARKQMNQHKQQADAGPLVLGISAPQGCGKTTLVFELEKLSTALGIRAASVSIDDFYLSHAAQQMVTAAHPDNPLLAGRGNAGTHDLQLGKVVLTNLRKLREGETAPLPRYNKAAFSGAGDTAPKETWPVVRGPLDLVLFEGWMLGFTALGPRIAAGTHPALDAVDQYLAAYKDAWDSHVHAWLVVAVENPRWVFQWRQEAEAQLRKQGLGGMTDEQVEKFVQRYIPAYTAYLPALYERGPTTCKPGHWLEIRVDQLRCLRAATAR